MPEKITLPSLPMEIHVFFRRREIQDHVIRILRFRSGDHGGLRAVCLGNARFGQHGRRYPPGGSAGDRLRSTVPPRVKARTGEQHRDQAGKRQADAPVVKIAAVSVTYDRVEFANGRVFGSGEMIAVGDGSRLDALFKAARVVTRIRARQRERFTLRRQRFHAGPQQHFIDAQNCGILFYKAFIKETSRKTFQIVLFDGAQIALRDAEFLRDLCRIPPLTLALRFQKDAYGGHMYDFPDKTPEATFRTYYNTPVK